MLLVNRRFKKKDAAEEQRREDAQEKEALSQKERQILMRNIQATGQTVKAVAVSMLSTKEDPLIANALKSQSDADNALNEYLIQRATEETGGKN